MGLYQLIYHSQALRPFETAALASLLHQARGFNQKHYLSGLLLHTPDGQFLQILEGEEAAVRALYYDHIVADPRHHCCRLLGAGACAERSFADWNMGFRGATALELHALLAAPSPGPSLADPSLVKARRSSPPSASALAQVAPLPRTCSELLALLLSFVANHESETDSSFGNLIINAMS